MYNCLNSEAHVGALYDNGNFYYNCFDGVSTILLFIINILIVFVIGYSLYFVISETYKKYVERKSQIDNLEARLSIVEEKLLEKEFCTEKEATQGPDILFTDETVYVVDSDGVVSEADAKK